MKYCWVDSWENFEYLVSANGSDEGVGAGNGGNDVLGDSKGQHLRNSFNIELFCPFLRFFVDPLHVFKVIIVPNLIFAFFFP